MTKSQLIFSESYVNGLYSTNDFFTSTFLWLQLYMNQTKQ